ncbi:MAG: tetratricopeptide repeat protein [Ignavibacteriae bacterium]|nr:tetratricopeptide repeat protein [Ignavibacteriota bacterium]
MNEIQLHTLLDKAGRFIEEGRLLHAAQIYHRLIALVPSCHEPYLQLAHIYLEWKGYRKAEKLLLRGERANPGNPHFLLMVANLHMREQRFDHALSCYNRLKHFRLPQVHFNIGLAYLNLGKADQAEEALRIASTLDPHFPKVHELLGEIMLRREKFTDAAKELKRALRHDPYSILGHRLLGKAYSQMGNWASAFNEFELAIDMDSQDARSWQHCGEALMRLGRFAEAEAYMKKALTLNPESPEALVSLGYICVELGHMKKALEVFDSALRMKPGDSRVANGKLLLRTHDKSSN